MSVDMASRARIGGASRGGSHSADFGSGGDAPGEEIGAGLADRCFCWTRSTTGTNRRSRRLRCSRGSKGDRHPSDRCRPRTAKSKKEEAEGFLT